MLGDECLWWKFDHVHGKFHAQHLGKSAITKLAQKVAEFNGYADFSSFSSHSFRHSGASALVNNGATTEQLMLSGAWCSEKVARGYIHESSMSAIEHTRVMMKSNSCPSLVDPSSSNIHVHVHLDRDGELKSETAK